MRRMVDGVLCRAVETIRHRTTLAASVILSIVAMGCGKGQLPTYPTQIKVHLADGQPAAGARVMLRPLDGGMSAKGVADADGIARMTTFKEGDGAVAGRHLAAVGPPSVEGDSDMNRASFTFAGRFSRFETSKLEFEVSGNGNQNEFEIVLTPN
ncbi:MAG: hypothetical protein SGJ20_15215 [Planctomycetota bacterium]|nr:hypothetical protein [Planctomycetota bacterium]